ncbi:hypothetical protein KBB96_02950 [Luteolibacter ambystomatis]|uniref:Uncharacterized protein n=1 Tax=Luteolibacter ambystomatis TaxID=2824561 RepID=A0A975J0N7_9BACT|nr:hypothetical protein [Luteolibacter ambystomatis]QUE51856.1 hypothetical protein KBB96_02950 [Luteolibacter ambystomatis]
MNARLPITLLLAFLTAAAPARTSKSEKSGSGKGGSRTEKKERAVEERPRPAKPERAEAAAVPTTPPPDVVIPKFPPTPTLGPEGVPDPALPKWTEADLTLLKSGKGPAASILLSEEMPPDESAEPKTQPPKVAGPTAEELAGDLTPSTAIPDKYLAAYFNERPKAFLVDPQKLLTPEQYRDRLAFLNYHAADSTIDLYVYIFGASQEIPGEVRAEELAERMFSSGRPAAFVYYFMGVPQRSVFYLSPSLTDMVSGVEQRRALQSSVLRALDKADPAEQLDAFSVQMSIRLYWMERMLAGGTIPENVAYVGNAPPKAPEKESKLEALYRKLPPRWWLPVSVILGSVVAGWSMRTWLQFRARYRFPEFDVEPRLGGDHAAGIGAVISFASSSLPPAVQREQVPDYLRRA